MSISRIISFSTYFPETALYTLREACATRSIAIGCCAIGGFAGVSELVHSAYTVEA
jgi:hypothetical protein